MVSTYGRVKNISRNSLLKYVYTGDDDRAQVRLSINGKQQNLFVSRLVAMTYIPNPQNLPEVDHIDENTHNNKVENLRWITTADNIRHSFAKPINQLTLDGKFVKRWDAIADARRAGFNPDKMFEK